MNSTEKKRVNFTEAEKALILRIVSKYTPIIENKSIKYLDMTKKNAAWEKIVAEYNRESSMPRNVRQLKLLYDSLKRSMRQDSFNEYEKRLMQVKEYGLSLSDEIKEIKIEPEEVPVITSVDSKLNADENSPPPLHYIQKEPTNTPAIVPGCRYFSNTSKISPVFVEVPTSVPEQIPDEPEKVPTRLKRRINYCKSRLIGKSLRHVFLNQQIRKGALKCRLLALQAQKVSLELLKLQLEIKKLK